MKKTVSSLWRDHKSTIPAVVHGDLTGQTVVVTGANTGIGLEAAKHLASMKPGRLILACRNEEKGKAAMALIKEDTGLEAVELWLLDLASFASVTAFADRFERDGGRLDILIANAAVGTAVYRVTKDKWEESLQVNVMSTALLCLRLAPRLVETANRYNGRPRVVVVNSEFHHFASFKEEIYDSPSIFETLNSKAHTTPSRMRNRYNETKLLVTFFVRSLSDALKSTGVIVTTATPGFSYSELNRDVKGPTRLILRFLQKIMAHEAEEGSRQLVYAAVGSAGNPDLINGQYIKLWNEVEEVNDHCLGEEGKKRQDKLWGDLVSELTKVDERVQGAAAAYHP